MLGAAFPRALPGPSRQTSKSENVPDSLLALARCQSMAVLHAMPILSRDDHPLAQHVITGLLVCDKNITVSFSDQRQAFAASLPAHAATAVDDGGYGFLRGGAHKTENASSVVNAG